MRWTEQEALDYALRRAKANPDRKGVHPTKPELPEGVPLDSACQRESKGCTCIKIRFVVYAVRPLDWDNCRFKEIQDCIVKSGILDDDKWDLLEGSIVSRKAHSKEEEKTVIEIDLP